MKTGSVEDKTKGQHFTFYNTLTSYCSGRFGLLYSLCAVVVWLLFKEVRQAYNLCDYKGSIPELALYYKVTWMTSRFVPHARELGREVFFDRVLYMHVRDFEFLILEMARTRIFKQKSGAL